MDFRDELNRDLDQELAKTQEGKQAQEARWREMKEHRRVRTVALYEEYRQYGVWAVERYQQAGVPGRTDRHSGPAPVWPILYMELFVDESSNTHSVWSTAGGRLLYGFASGMWTNRPIVVERWTLIVMNVRMESHCPALYKGSRQDVISLVQQILTGETPTPKFAT